MCYDRAEEEGRSVSGRHLSCNESKNCFNYNTCDVNNAGDGEILQHCEYSITFADHSKMKGMWMSDIVTLRDSRVDSSATLRIRHKIAELSEMGFLFKYGPHDGVLGLAPRSTSLHSMLFMKVILFSY